MPPKKLKADVKRILEDSLGDETIRRIVSSSVRLVSGEQIDFIDADQIRDKLAEALADDDPDQPKAVDKLVGS